MTTKLLKTIKLVLALSSAVIFFIFSFSEFGEFNYYIGQHYFYFSIGLIVVLVLAIYNYFSANGKYDAAINASALFMAASFAFKLFAETDWFFYSNSYGNVFLGMLLPAMLAAIFMLDRKFNIKMNRLYFQLGLITLIYLLYLIAFGDGIGTTIFIVLLLCTFYIISPVSWLRIFIYSILAYYLYSFFASLPTEIHVVRLFQPTISGLELMHRVFVDYFWELLIVSVLALVLIFNKPVQQGSSWFKKLISKFR